MSLKIEQRIIGKQITEFEPRIYSTGVHLIPLMAILNGVEKFIWVADEFSDETFFDGQIISANVLSSSIDAMFSV